MRPGMLKRLPALTLLIALGFGILGQIAVAAAMPLDAQMPPGTTAIATGLAAVPGICPACPEHRRLPAAPAMMPGCAMSLCSVMPAIVPLSLPVASVVRAAFPPLATPDRSGLTLRPDLGPPRPLRLA